MTRLDVATDGADLLSQVSAALGLQPEDCVGLTKDGAEVVSPDGLQRGDLLIVRLRPVVAPEPEAAPEGAAEAASLDSAAAPAPGRLRFGGRGAQEDDPSPSGPFDPQVDPLLASAGASDPDPSSAGDPVPAARTASVLDNDSLRHVYQTFTHLTGPERLKKLRDEDGITVSLVNDGDLKQWYIQLFDFPEGSDLSAGLADIQSKFGKHFGSVVLTLSFPTTFPHQPPLLRVVRPRLEHGTAEGNVTWGGVVSGVRALAEWTNPAEDVHNKANKASPSLSGSGLSTTVHQATEEELFSMGLVALKRRCRSLGATDRQLAGLDEVEGGSAPGGPKHTAATALAIQLAEEACAQRMKDQEAEPGTRIVLDSEGQTCSLFALN
jgi:hypothetical protein